eukprot:2056421-Pleurochrysis_carterae.AAC.2
MPKSSAAGMERLGFVKPVEVCASQPRSSRRGAAARVSASWMSVGHTSDTSQISSSRPATNAWPPTPSTPLVSVTTETTPSSSGAWKTALGASGTPSFVPTRSAATSNSSSQSRSAAPPGRSAGIQSSPFRQPPATPPRGGCATA